MDKNRKIDPLFLEQLGTILSLINLVEQALPEDFKVSKRHEKVDSLLGDFKKYLDDARFAVRTLTATMEYLDSDVQRKKVGFYLSSTEFEIYRRALNQLQKTINKLTKTSHNLEATLANINNEEERFYKISVAGRPILKAIANMLNKYASESDQSCDITLSKLLQDVEVYLSSCSKRLEERDEWLYK